MELLDVPRTGGPTEDEIVQQLVREADPSGATPLYEDPEFCPSEPSTLYVDAEKLPEYAGDPDHSVAWYRPTEYTDDPDYFKSPSGCGVLREGALHDAWLLGVFAAVALHPDALIENLFVSESLDQFKQHGVYTCRFYKNAHWVHVTTDTRVPYSVELSDDELRPAKGASTPGHLLYGASLNKNEVFVPLLEKAYAKLHGSYQALAEGHGGSVSGKILEAFLDCTGGSAHRIDLMEEKRRVQHDARASVAGSAGLQDATAPDDAGGGDAESAKAGDSSDASEQDLELSALWRRVVRYVKRKCIVTAQLRQLSFNAYDLTPTGILKNRQYVVLHTKEVSLGSSKGSNNNNNNHASSAGSGSGSGASAGAGAGGKEPVLRFVKLKNVWGRGMWKGEWSNDDSKWEEHLQVENALRNDAACAFSRSGTDGCFWMVWEDLIEVFNELYVVHVFGNDDASYQYNVAGEWLGFSAAGAPTPSLSGAAPRPGTTAVNTNANANANASNAEDDAVGWRKGERPIERTKWSVLRDADPNWHRNPQFRLSVAERTRGVLLSLAQRDFRLFGGDNYAINLVLVAQKPTRTAMLWEHPPPGPKIAAEAHSFATESHHGHHSQQQQQPQAPSHHHRPTTSGAAAGAGSRSGLDDAAAGARAARGGRGAGARARVLPRAVHGPRQGRDGVLPAGHRATPGRRRARRARVDVRAAGQVAQRRRRHGRRHDRRRSAALAAAQRRRERRVVPEPAVLAAPAAHGTAAHGATAGVQELRDHQGHPAPHVAQGRRRRRQHERLGPRRWRGRRQEPAPRRRQGQAQPHRAHGRARQAPARQLARGRSRGVSVRVSGGSSRRERQQAERCAAAHESAARAGEGAQDQLSGRDRGEAAVETQRRRRRRQAVVHAAAQQRHRPPSQQRCRGGGGRRRRRRRRGRRL
ncbi:hypothetical protein PINS_up008987 [Pythium insidiosum]|nr:hypothetical protein PINS_up008987 [Pythium insidiosum]